MFQISEHFEFCVLELGVFNLNFYSEWESGPIYPGLNLWYLFNVTLFATKVAPRNNHIRDAYLSYIYIYMIDIFHIYVCLCYARM